MVSFTRSVQYWSVIGLSVQSSHEGACLVGAVT